MEEHRDEEESVVEVARHGPVGARDAVGAYSVQGVGGRWSADTDDEEEVEVSVQALEIGKLGTERWNGLG